MHVLNLVWMAFLLQNWIFPPCSYSFKKKCLSICHWYQVFWQERLENPPQAETWYTMGSCFYNRWTWHCLNSVEVYFWSVSYVSELIPVGFLTCHMLIDNRSSLYTILLVSLLFSSTENRPDRILQYISAFFCSKAKWGFYCNVFVNDPGLLPCLLSKLCLCLVKPRAAKFSRQRVQKKSFDAGYKHFNKLYVEFFYRW